MDRLVTLFGGGGFLGRYVAQELLGAGARVRIAGRNPRDAWFVKPLGGLGQVQFMAADVARPDSAMRAAADADVVVNLVGILKGNFTRVHAEGAANVAKAAARAGAKALVQISAIGADPDSPSAYGRSKGLGEAAARDAFPGVTVIRPSIVFGPEDHFVNRFANMAQRLPLLPVIRPQVKLQPVYVTDVARAIAAAALDPAAHGGRTYELGGPQVLTMQELNMWIARAIDRDPAIMPVPDAAAELMARLTGWMPGAPMTWDQWLMLARDNVVDSGAEGLDAFGIAPTPLAAAAPGWLVRYRRHGRFTKMRSLA